MKDSRKVKLPVVVFLIMVGVCVLIACGKNEAISKVEQKEQNKAAGQDKSEEQTESGKENESEKQDKSEEQDNRESVSIDEELANIEQEVTMIENKLQAENITQTEMTIITAEVYQLWDAELNSVWNQLKEKLDTTAMEKLTAEEREWIAYKEAEIKKAGIEYEGGTMQPMMENDKGAELTRERVYELVEMLY